MSEMETREYTDAELDRDWQPNGRRPQSTIARSFSQELMDIFRIDNSLTDLDNQVDQRRATVNRNTRELASLEARLREMEDRLKKNRSNRSDLAAINTEAPVNSQQHPDRPPPPPPKDASKSRPGTARAPQQAPSAGNMPPTPGASEGEYYIVTKADLDDAPR